MFRPSKIIFDFKSLLKTLKFGIRN